MSPEKRDVYVRFPEGAKRQPFEPRHTSANEFPPPGSDIRRHGSTDFVVSGSNVYNGGNRDMSTPGNWVEKLSTLTYPICCSNMHSIKSYFV